uniref:Uncharacterized protein n=1 Tax=Aplanochytrium stocchinoi TaxID=215587 RepID=A0A7S3PT12_9STRA|mmetsp:Transcript_17044/g.21011  ORF Transcript_17044/g.21011 Transcript_17044/m.21011 type:complete len:101 (+) Transcript_17044:119-421(+)
MKLTLPSLGTEVDLDNPSVTGTEGGVTVSVNALLGELLIKQKSLIEARSLILEEIERVKTSKSTVKGTDETVEVGDLDNFDFEADDRLLELLAADLEAEH